MIILEDTRQQRRKHNLKREYFRKNNIIVKKVTLDCGDYTLINDRSVVVDTKKDIQELIGDIQVKSITLKELEREIGRIFEKFNITNVVQNEITRIIFDKDVGRYPEREILEFCNKNQIDDDAEKEFQKLYVKRHGFFHRGLKRAEYGDVKLYILVENEENVKSVDDLDSWINPRLKMQKWITTPLGERRKVLKYPSAMKGETLAKSLRTMQERYSVKFLFCQPEDAGAKVLELLGVEV